MPVPKRKTSKARRDQRSSTKFIRAKCFVKCSNCEHTINPHQLCEQCGFYKGRKIMVTKLERAINRNETKQALYAKRAQEQKDLEQNFGKEG